MQLDFSGFHSGCTNKLVVRSDDGLAIVCLDCGVMANLEAVSGKISPGDACKVGKIEREVLGKQSKNVNKGVFVP